jgi:hypothetical protein
MKNMNKHKEQVSTNPNSSLKKLEILVGVWNMEGSHPLFTSVLHGRSSFEWLTEEGLLLWHFDFEQSGPPIGTSVIGHDDASETYSMLYFDERGVSRIYEMSLDSSLWKLWRNATGFSQRFTGTFSDDRNTIIGCWEKSTDGSNWENDLEVTYTRAG